MFKMLARIGSSARFNEGMDMSGWSGFARLVIGGILKESCCYCTSFVLSVPGGILSSW